MVIVTKFILQHNIAAEIRLRVQAFTLQAMATQETILVLVLIFITLLRILFPIVWPS
jgi:hypothetical protein